MKVLLVKDVYKLGHAGDIKKVANGYGRNYLLPNGMAVLATPGAISQADHIRKEANEQRAVLNNEMSGLAEKLQGMRLTFSSKAGETGKLYGSVTNQMIAERLSEKLGQEIDRRQIESEPIRNLGEHKVNIRLTVDLIPQVSVLVHREGEAPVEETPAVEEAEIEEVEVEEPAAEMETGEEDSLEEQAG
jgi:large subunit ribosomal protein L9